jgi:hypothetical protein
MGNNAKNWQAADETARLNKVVENFPHLTQGTDQVRNLPEIELPEEEVRYLEQHGTLPESTVPDPLRKAT